MAGLDFRRGAELFIGTERELAQALGISADELVEYHEHPKRAPDDVMTRLGGVLAERGRGMVRVGELMQDGG